MIHYNQVTGTTMNTNKFFSIATAALLLLGANATLQAQKLDVSASGNKTVKLSDKVGKNQFTWVSDAPLEKIKGTATGISGSFSIDPANLSGIRGTISATVSTMKTGNSTRDKHLQGSDWLDASKFPKISFSITSVNNVKVNGNSMTATAVGNFTMHGVTKQISIPFSLTYLDESAKTKKRAPGDLVMIEATFNVSLADFQVKGKDGIVGSKVGESIAVTAKLFGATGL